MIISWKWLSEYVDLSSFHHPKELADLLTSRGLEVESIHSLSEGFEEVCTAQILKKEKHPDADRLNLCQVTDGGEAPLQIVCGAQNMVEGDVVALAKVGASLPNGLKIKASKIRGQESFGMLCSEEELGLADESEGILVLPREIEVGQPVAKVLGRDDTQIEIGLTPNRGDCLSHFGVAREVAAARGLELRVPREVKIPWDSPCAIQTELKAGGEGPQFFGCMIEGVKVGESPAWLKKKLESIGSRSINNIVDATNFVLFEYGHPMHAYDADRLEGETLSIRLGKPDEKLPLLDDTSVVLSGEELVIADGSDRPVSLAGVMGGGNSEVLDTTTRIYLECAEFHPGRVRKAASRHQKHTDSSHRFERGVDPLGLERAISRLAHIILEVAGGEIKGGSRSVSEERDPTRSYSQPKIQVAPQFLRDYLGLSESIASNSVMKDHLTSLGFQVSDGEIWDVTVPSFRNDVRIREDLTEEIARSVGYDHIPSEVPPLSSHPTDFAPELKLIDLAKDSLASSGLFETVSFSFTSQKKLSRFGLSSEVELLNPLSEEYQWMVPSLLPGLVEKTIENWKRHFGSDVPAVRLFELRPTFFLSPDKKEVKAYSSSETGVSENWKLSFALSGNRYAQALSNEQSLVDFSDVKAILDRLVFDLDLRGLRFHPLAETRLKEDRIPPSLRPIRGLFHPGLSVEVFVGKDLAGYVGQIHPQYAQKLKLKNPIWLAELDWSTLSQMSNAIGRSRVFESWSEHPVVERDFALLVKSDVSVDKITQVAMKAGRPLAKAARVFDIYRGSSVAEGMTSVAVRVIFSEEGRSLKEQEADQASTQILEKWKKELGAELRS